MDGRKFAFEYGGVSIVFYSIFGLGDAVIARKVLEALVELAPDCLVDVVCATEGHTAYTKAFYGDIKNLNRLIIIPEYVEHEKKYDLALGVGGCHATLVKFANIKRLEAFAPALAQSVLKIIQYNDKNFVSEDTWRTYIALRNMISAKILGKSCCEFLSCDGALPIRDNKINIPLASEYQSKFDELKLDKYITIYTNISESEKARPKVKTWPIRYWYEYVARMKNRFPQIEIIQAGGGIKIVNADRFFSDCDLELTKYILANSLLHVGCEGGLVHLATALGTKCLVLFGTNCVEYFGYTQNINLVSEICTPCMYILFDGSACLRGAKEPPCMLNHTPQTVCEVTCTYLKNFS